MKKIRPLSRGEINKLIKQRKLEEPALIKHLETQLKKKRGRVIQLPKKKSPVILMVSGGLDSSIVWAYLMEVYGLEVFPVFFNRGQKRVRIEEASVDIFSEILRAKYPKLWNPVTKLDAFIPPMEIRFPITTVSNNSVGKKGQWKGIPAYTNILFSYAAQFASYLEITRDIKTRTIFGGFMLSDGETMKDQTLSAIRAVNLSICATTDDYSWQTIALPIEKELGFFHDKQPFIKWGSEQGLPLEKTRTCINPTTLHCGVCVSCIHRQRMFEEAGVEDKTKYQQKFDYLEQGQRLRQKILSYFPKPWKEKTKHFLKELWSY